MDYREAARYSIDKIDEELQDSEIFFELDLNGIIRGTAVDVSLLGLGLIIHDINEKQIDKLKKMDELFIKLFIGEEIMLVGVKIVWNRLISEAGKMVFKSGVKINIISPEDKLKLAVLVGKLRKKIIM